MAIRDEVDLLNFELPRRMVVFTSRTTMPDGTTLGVTGDPNDALTHAQANNTNSGEYLLNNCPPMTIFLDTVGDDVWRKTMVNTWSLLEETFNGDSLLDHIWYDDVLDRIVSDRPIQTTLSSFYLGGQHKISSGGENVFFTNLRSGVNWFPVWQGLKDQRDLINQGPEGVYKATTRTYSEDMVSLSFIGEHPDLLPFTGDIQGSFTFNLSLFGIEFRSMLEIEEGDKVKISAYMDGGEEITYQQTITPEEAQPSGNLFELMFEHPFEFHAGTWVATKVFIVKETPSGTLEIPMIFTTDLNGFAYAAFRFRSFSDKLVTTEEDLVSINLEIGKGYKLLKSTTVLTNNVLLGFDLNPNTATEGNTDGEDLIYHASLGTGFIQQDGTSWQKVEDTSGGSWTNNGVVIDEDGNPTTSPVVAEAVAKSVGASEYVLAEAGSFKTLHTSDLLVLTDHDGKALLWHDWSSETGQGDWAFANQIGLYTLHKPDYQVLTDDGGEIIIWANSPSIIFESEDESLRFPTYVNHITGKRALSVMGLLTTVPSDVLITIRDNSDKVVGDTLVKYVDSDSDSDGVSGPIRVTLEGVSEIITPYTTEIPSNNFKIKIEVTDITTMLVTSEEFLVYKPAYPYTGFTAIDSDLITDVKRNHAHGKMTPPYELHWSEDFQDSWYEILPMEIHIAEPASNAVSIHEFSLTLFAGEFTGWMGDRYPSQIDNRVIRIKLIDPWSDAEGSLVDEIEIQEIPKSFLYQFDFKRANGRWYHNITKLVG